MHGGILSDLADEAMMQIIRECGPRAMTAELTIRFHNYSKAGVKLFLEAYFVNRTSKLIEAERVIRNDAGSKIATGKGEFLPVSGKDATDLRKKF